MYPLIDEEDVLVVEKRKSQQIHVGDIICFWRNNKAISHRVIRKTNSVFITKGDQSWRPDTPPVEEKDIIGVVTEIKSKFGKKISLGNSSFQLFNRLHTTYILLTIKFPFIRKIPKGGQLSLKKWLRRS